MIKQFNKLENIKPADTAVYERIIGIWDSIAKPLRGLGRFEEMIAQIGAVLHTDNVDIRRRAAVIMCADNGIVGEGVSQSGQDVTAAVAGWMGKDLSSVCRIAGECGTDIIKVDIGIDMEGSPEGVVNKKIRRGTADFLTEPAMSEEELMQAVQIGTDIVGECRDKGYTIIATGEMGIGNTTTSAAVCAALLNLPADLVTGRGAGLDDSGFKKKKKIIEEALQKYDFKGRADVSREYAIKVLRTVGGLDIAGLAGVFIGGALYNIPIVIDGFISAVAALAAERLLPGTKDVMIASHLGREEGMGYVLRELGLKAVIDADMALGEGTGALMLFPLLDCALELYKNGLKFEDTEVEQYKHFGKNI